MAKRGKGRPKNPVLKSAIYVSLTLEELTLLERVGWFLSRQRDRHQTRNDGLAYVIHKHVKPQVKEAEKLLARYKKEQEAKGETYTDKGFGEYMRKHTEVENEEEHRPVTETANASANGEHNKRQ